MVGHAPDDRLLTGQHQLRAIGCDRQGLDVAIVIDNIRSTAATVATSQMNETCLCARSGNQASAVGRELGGHHRVAVILQAWQ